MLSWRWPPVTRRCKGRPCRSARMLDLGAKAAPVAAQCGLRLFLFGRARRAHVRAHDRAVQEHGGQIRLGLQMGQQARPDAPAAPGRITAIDRVPLSLLGRQRAPRCAHPCHPAQRFHEKTAMCVLAYAYVGTGIQKRTDTEPLGIGHQDMSHRGPSSGQHAKDKVSWEDNRGRAGCPGNGARGGAQTRVPRGHPLRQICATVPGFSVSVVSWALAEFKSQHYLKPFR